MVLLQASVGSLNDVIDAPRDAGLKPGKPIPAGLASPRSALLVSAVAGLGGVVLAIPSGLATVVLALGLLGLGYAYDLWFKGTAWSWVPFALAIPLFPTYGWLGAAGSIPAVWTLLLPVAVLAGAGLAIANARVDVERDVAAGTASVATRLGLGRAWVVHAVALGIVVIAAVASLVVAGALVPAVGAAVAGLLLMVGITMSRTGLPPRREAAWRIEAVATGLLAAIWLLGMRLVGMA
jgi:4-hydroxybenzoate polyprenyltransferase